MADWLRQTHLVKQIATQILLPKQTNYHEDFLIYKMSKFHHLQFKNFKVANQFNQLLQSTIVMNKLVKNDVCIIFLHGYCSNRLEGLSLLQSLPKDIDFCCFDFSSSGKSQGNINTFGIKQFKDIRTIITKLKAEEFAYKKFILWGRSMGAVASMLFSCSNEHEDIILKKDLVFQVLDSAFSSFESICYHQGKQSLKLPQAFIGFGISILKDYFIQYQFQRNPFNINLKQVAARCQTSSLFIFNETDSIIPPTNSLQIIQCLPKSTYYQKFIINEHHNSLRKDETNEQILTIVRKNYLKWLYNKKQHLKSEIDLIWQKNKQKTKLNLSNHIRNNSKSSNRIQCNQIFQSKQTISSQTAIRDNNMNNFQKKFSFKKRAIYCSLHKMPSQPINAHVYQFKIEKRKSLLDDSNKRVENQQV